MLDREQAQTVAEGAIAVQAGRDATVHLYGITNIEVAKQLGVAEAAVSNFFQILKEQHVPVHEWDQAMRMIAERHNEMLDRVRVLDSDDPVVEQLRSQATQAIESGDYRIAEDYLERAVARDNEVAQQLKSSFQKRKLSAAQSQALKAESLFTRFELDKAIEAYEVALLLAIDAESVDLQSEYRNNLGLVLKTKGELDKAIRYYEEALVIDLATYSDEHPNVAIRLSNLGGAWKAKGDLDKAIDYFERALDIGLLTYGDGHPKVAIRRNNLGSAWQDKGELDKAISYYEQALSSDRATYGDSHPNVAIRRNNLGSAWQDKGELDKAIGYYEQALSSDRATYGDGHPNVAIRLNNLGMAWAAKGELDKAIEHFERALNIALTKFGEEHPNSSNVRENLERTKRLRKQSL